MAEMPMPEFPMPVAVTRHLKRLSLLHLGQHVVLSLPVAQSRGIHAFGAGFS